ncbi:MAG: hypothetical protein FJ000_09370, partial [Actinobacteria bacterium]|nr:hypothetical protein [Actinomycetota bacterium]
MSTSPLPFDSDALRANIATTAQEVVIPDRYLRLVASVEGFHGVRSSLTETLGEYFHTFRNTDALIEGFQTILLRNWSYFERSDDRAEAFELLAELILGLLDEPLTDAQLSSLLRELLMWSRSALEGRHGDTYDDSVGLIGEYLSGLLPDRPVPFLERDVLLRNLVRRAGRRPGLAAGFLDLYRELLLQGYRRVAARLDVPEWATTGAGELTDPDAVADRFGFLERQRLADLLAAAEAAGRDDLLDSGLPLFSDILGQVIDEVFRVENLEDRFAACLYLLKDDTLGHRQNEVMVDLLTVVKQMMDPDRHMDAERILSRLTAFFRDRDNEFLVMRFRCYEAIGVAIGEAGNVRAADHLINDILYWKFQYPEISGATDEWETVVNPFHLPKIRTWMQIIESNPALYERLAAALNVQLRLGGVYIADTDLFQRDVTQFLNADIRPIYFVAKQLLRTLPVYFNEVGAEGELRSVSTEMDELSNRHDTLVHFLRKQSHTESSNRLLSFSRAALCYWLTRDPAGLRPYLSANTLTAVEGQPEWAAGPHRVLAALHRHWSAETAGGPALRPADEPSGDGGEVPPEAA